MQIHRQPPMKQGANVGHTHYYVYTSYLGDQTSMSHYSFRHVAIGSLVKTYIATVVYTHSAVYVDEIVKKFLSLQQRMAQVIHTKLYKNSEELLCLVTIL